ncbi:hypothetical protein ARMGADRAFT_1032596 [Armillaria gallica]|uniref:Uncharacterized protein n=1 Tax=Armillaria gallica TaxID=47427 RepID=A0A2H3DGL8_ARMGA|nr:hypothetical protein ARMGADRAFT_1032596 [Armillaria gallica]
MDPIQVYVASLHITSTTTLAVIVVITTAKKRSWKSTTWHAFRILVGTVSTGIIAREITQVSRSQSGLKIKAPSIRSWKNSAEFIGKGAGDVIKYLNKENVAVDNIKSNLGQGVTRLVVLGCSLRGWNFPETRDSGSPDDEVVINRVGEQKILGAQKTLVASPSVHRRRHGIYPSDSNASAWEYENSDTERDIRKR